MGLINLDVCDRVKENNEDRYPMHGTVIEVYTDDTFKVKWDDGGIEDDVPMDAIKPANDRQEK